MSCVQIDLRIVFRLWRRDRLELAVLALTFCVSVARTVELAVLAGALASLAVLLRRLMRPRVHVHTLKTSAGEVVRVRAALGVLYVSAELLARRVQRAAALAAPRPVLLDCQHHALLDYAAEKVLERLINKFKTDERLLILYNVPQELLHKYERLAGVDPRPLRAASVGDALAAVAHDADENVTLLASTERDPHDAHDAHDPLV